MLRAYFRFFGPASLGPMHHRRRDDAIYVQAGGVTVLEFAGSLHHHAEPE